MSEPGAQPQPSEDECDDCGYRWDVFLSYRRQQGWVEWIDRHFQPLFELFLEEDLERPPRIFIDRRAREPGPWPDTLGRALASSRLLIPLLSRAYFKRPWCKAEYDLMRLRADHHRSALILPAIIHDGGGPDFAHAEGLECLDLTDYSNPGMPKESATREALGWELRDWTPIVANAVAKAPPHDRAWRGFHVQAMTEVKEDPSQTHLPGWGR